MKRKQRVSLCCDIQSNFRCGERHSRNSEEIRRAHEGVLQPLWVWLIPERVSGVRNSIPFRCGADCSEIVRDDSGAREALFASWDAMAYCGISRRRNSISFEVEILESR